MHTKAKRKNPTKTPPEIKRSCFQNPATNPIKVPSSKIISAIL
jgi:hypothetical protein